MKYKILYLFVLLAVGGINLNAQAPKITIERTVNTDNSIVLSYKKEENSNKALA